MKLGYSTWGMPAVPVETAIRHIAGLGFEGIELTVIPGYTSELSQLDGAARRQIAHLLAETGLTLSAISANTNLSELDPKKYAQNLAFLKGAIDLAVDLAQGDHRPVINTTPGGQPEQWPEYKGMLVERAAELAEYAASRGVVIGMEPHIKAIIERPGQMVELLNLVASPYLKVNFDISHFDILGMAIEETVAALAPYTVHTHVKDQRGRYPDYEFLIPGEGDFDYVTYLKTMAAHGYEGFITAEVSKMVQRREDYDPLAGAELSYRTLSRAFREAGLHS
jgi:inosose dehydratase